MQQYALLKRMDALELAVTGLIQQQRALTALPDIVCDQVRLSELRWNLVMARACGQPALEKAKRELDEHADFVAQKYGNMANG